MLTKEKFSKYSHYFLLLYTLSAAISIAASQIILISLILYWVILLIVDKDSRIVIDKKYSSPFFYWFLACLISALVGIAPMRSVQEVFKTSIFLFLPLIIYYSFHLVSLNTREYLVRIESYIIGLIFSQSIAALHSILTDAFKLNLPRLLPGPVTESGQLVLTIPLALLSVFYFFSNLKEQNKIKIFNFEIPPIIFAGLLFAMFLIIAWPQAIVGEGSLAIDKHRYLALLIVLGLSFPLIRRGTDSLKEKLFGQTKMLKIELFHLVWIAISLLFAALLINLKRGPWFGVFVEILVIGLLLSRRLLVWSIIGGVFLMFALSPARERIFAIGDHFNISGGRKAMWELGMELSQRFPLGLGPNNAKYMQELDDSIPFEHRHMHNNLLNVLAETGWIGIGVFIWWMYLIVKLGFNSYLDSLSQNDKIRSHLGLLALCLTSALIGWQVSGVVEYNFGDGEIRLIALFYMGLLFVIDSFPKRNEENLI